MSNPWAKSFEDLRAPYLQEKKAKKDYDGDGKIESGTDEYMGSKDKAIKKAMAMRGKKKVAEHHQKDKDGNTIPHGDGTPSSVEEGKKYGPNNPTGKIGKGLIDKALNKLKNNTPVKKVDKAHYEPEGDVVSEEDKKGKGSGKKDACYDKVKASASVWPSAYASGRLVQCRKKGAANYGKSKKEDFDFTIKGFGDYVGECWKTHKKVGMKMKGGKMVNDCRPKNEDHTPANAEYDSIVKKIKDPKTSQEVKVGLDAGLTQGGHSSVLQTMSKDKKIKEGAPYTVTNADKSGNTPAYQGLKSGKLNKLTGKPLYKAAPHLQLDKAHFNWKEDMHWEALKRPKLDIKETGVKNKIELNPTVKTEAAKAPVKKPKKAQDAGARARRLLQRKEYRAKVSEFVPKELEDSVQYDENLLKDIGSAVKGGLNKVKTKVKDAINRPIMAPTMTKDQHMKNIRKGGGDPSHWESFNTEANSAQQKAMHAAKIKKKEDDKVAEKKKLKEDMKGMSQKSGDKRSTDSGAGMTAKGVAKYNRRTGGNLKTAVTTPPSKLKAGSKAAKRRKSFCARSKSWDGPRGKAARRRWNCEYEPELPMIPESKKKLYNTSPLSTRVNNWSKKINEGDSYVKSDRNKFGLPKDLKSTEKKSDKKSTTGVNYGAMAQSYEPQGEVIQEKSCGKGEYYCNDDQKCKPIPDGYKEGKDGMLVKEAKYEKGASDYGKTSIRNKRAFGKGGNARPPKERGAAKMLRHDSHTKRRGVKKNNKYGATNKPPVYGAPSDEFKKNKNVKENALINKIKNDFNFIKKAKDTVNTYNNKLKKNNDAINKVMPGSATLSNEGNLHKWFSGSKSKDGKKGWVNVVTGGTCASDKPGEGTPKCVSSSKRASMTKAERLSASRRKKKADPGQQSKSGAAKPTYVATDKKKKKVKESAVTPKHYDPIPMDVQGVHTNRIRTLDMIKKSNEKFKKGTGFNLPIPLAKKKTASNVA